MRHNAIKRIGITAQPVPLRDDPRALTQIIKYEHDLDKYPAICDVFSSAMPEIRIKRFSAGGTQKHRAKNKKPTRIVDQQLDGIPWIERTHYKPAVGKMTCAHHPKHKKPHEHEWSEKTPYSIRAKTLNEKNAGNDYQHNRQHRSISFQRTHTLDRRSYSHGGSNDTVGDERARSHRGKNIQPPPLHPFNQGIKSKYATLPLVIGTQCNDHIFQRGLQRKGPYHT